MARKAIEDHESITVNVSDLHADAAEVAIMRRDGDKSLLILPMIHQGQAIGLLEVLDHQRERRFSRQEMRLANALAGQAAVAMRNAKVFAQLKRSDQDVLALRHAIEQIAAGHAALLSQDSPTAVLQAAADLATRALDAMSCVAGWNGVSAGATGAPGGAGAAGTTLTDAAYVIVSTAPCAESQLALTLTLGHSAGEGQAELLGLVAAMAAGALAGLPAS
jgi:GAF domain-containing protein